MVAPVVAAAAAPTLMQTLGPTLLGGAFGLFGSKSQNKENQAASAKQMEFQERMSSTAYQRGMEDMKKAGLNPILAYSKGGASTPGGSTYQAQNIGQAAVQGSQQAILTANSAADLRLKQMDIAYLKSLAVGKNPPPGPVGYSNAGVNNTGGRLLNQLQQQMLPNINSAKTFKEDIQRVKDDPNSSYNKFKRKSEQGTKSGASRTDKGPSKPLRIYIPRPEHWSNK